MSKRRSSLFDGLEQSLNDALAYAKGTPRAGTKTVVLRAAKPRTASQIRKLRQTLKLTQSQLAMVLSVSVKTVESWESGTKHPTGPALRLFELLERPDVASSLLSQDEAS